MKQKTRKKLISVLLIVVLLFTNLYASYTGEGAMKVQAAQNNDLTMTQNATWQEGEYTTCLEKAEELKTPLAIYNYLKNNINYEHYSGMRKGAEATFDSLGGNDVDQAVLLSAMLEHNGYETRYVTGTIRLTSQQAINLTGATDAHVAADILGMSGYSVVKVLNADGSVESIEMEHTWLEAYVPYENYRGAGANEGACLWIPLDTGIKAYEDNETVYEYLEEYRTTDIAELQEKLEECDGEIYLNNRKIVQSELKYLPLSLQYEVIGEATRSDEIDDGRCDSITFAMEGTESITLKSHELYNKRLTVTYKNISDTATQAELCLNGQVILTGNLVSPGQEENFTMTVKSSGKTTTIENTLYAGGLYQITVDTQNITARELSEAIEALKAISATVNEENVCTDEYLGVLLDYVGKMYFAQVDIENHIMAEQLNVTKSRSLSVGMTGYRVKPVTMNGILCGIDGGSLYIDIDHNVYTCKSNEGNEEHIGQYMLATGMMSSALESSIWEQTTGIPSISTMTLFEEAISMDTEIVMLTQANWQERKADLKLNAETLSDIEREINNGKTVVVPVEEQIIDDWKGTGYMVLDMENYAGSYMISGGLNGGTIGADVGFAMLVNIIMTSFDMVQTAHLYPMVLKVLATGGFWGTLFGMGLLLLTTIIYIWIIEECERNFNLWYEYLDGNEQAGDALIGNACLNVVITAGISAGVRVGSSLADNFIRKQAVKTINKIAGEEIAENLIENASKPGAVANAIKTMQKNGVTQEAIKKVVTTLPEDSILKIGKLTKKNVPQEFIEKLIDNKVVLENVSDATILAFKESAESYDDIIRILERHGDKLKPLYEIYGDTMVDVVLKYGDEAIAGINNHGDEFLNYYFCYGDDFAKNYFKNSDVVIEVILKYSDDAAAGLKNHGEEFVNYYKKYGDDFAKNYFKNSDVVIEVIMKYGDEAVAGLKNHSEVFVNFYKEYGDDFAKCYFNNSDTVIEILTKYGDEGANGLKNHGEEFVKYYSCYGEEFAKCYFKDSDTVIEILIKYGDDGAAGLKAHDDTFVDLYVTYGDKFVEDYLKYQDEAVGAYTKHGDEASDVLNGNKTDDGSGLGDLPSETEPALPEGGNDKGEATDETTPTKPDEGEGVGDVPDETTPNLPEDASSVKLTEPTLPKGGKPEGNYEQPVPGKDGDPIRRQNESADLLAENGYDIQMLPYKVDGNGYGIKPSSNPDYLIDGEVFDCFSPDGTRARNVWDTVKKKTETQAERIILNLDDYQGAVDELYNQFMEWNITTLKELIVIKEGTITRWLPQ